MKNFYFFIFGRNQALAVAEIESRLKDVITSRYLGESFYIIETKTDIDMASLQKTLGSVIKVGVMLDMGGPDINQRIFEYLKNNSTAKKLLFGINGYGCSIKALKIKKQLKDAGVTCRLVTSNEPQLSSVITQKEILNKNGIELNCFKTGDECRVGKTFAVQPFAELSFRDWQRPAKDQRSGMLPPKLAMMMLNFSQAKHDFLILDPFCGSGTILAEAALQGYQNLIGSDISQKAIDDSVKNIEWLKNNQMILPDTKIKLLVSDIDTLGNLITKESVDAIVTEPYLGPALKKGIAAAEISKIITSLEDLYIKTFGQFGNILKTDGRVVIIFPVFMANGQKFLNIIPKIKKLGFKIVNPIEHTKFSLPEQTERGAILYARPDQQVGREIFIFEKQ